MACGSEPKVVTLAASPTAALPEHVRDDRGGAWRPNEHFRLRVEQDGAELRVRDHEVTLARRTFTLAFELRGIRVIEVNASWSPDVLRRASARGDLDDVFGDGRGLAEERSNPSHVMFTNDEGYNYWGWDDDVQRCHVHEVHGDVMLCKRIVTMLGPTGEEDLARSTGAALYLVIVAQEQREWLTLRFS